MRRTPLLVVHCSATRPDQDIGVDEIRKWHIERGWSDVGYHAVIRRSGELELGRPVEKIGSHARGWNANSIGVCLVGGVDREGKPENNFMSAQFDTLTNYLLYARQELGVFTVVGHRDLLKEPERERLGRVAKDCPSFDVVSWVYLNQRLHHA